MRRILWVAAMVLLAALCAIPFHPGGVVEAETVEVGDAVPSYAPATTDTGSGLTILSDVPADATGYLRTITMYVGTAGATGIKVGTFYETGVNTYKCRAVVGISNQTTGKKTIRLDNMGSAISMECHAGDLIGFYCSGGDGLRHYDDGDTGRLSVAGDYVTFDAEATFTPIASQGLLLHGSSSTSYFQVLSAVYPTWYDTQVSLVCALNGTHSDAWGVVVGETSHDEPGDIAPSLQTDYMVDRYQVSETHNDTFDVDYSPSGMTGGVTFYARVAVYFDAPYNMWVYGWEMSFEQPAEPGEECHHQTGYEPVEYTCVYTDNVTVDEHFGDLIFNGSVDSADTGIDRAGWVYDTVSHANPDGWPVDYSDLAPEASDYPNVLDATVDDWMQTVFQKTVSGWPGGATYYYRFFVDFATPGDYIYGPELTFEFPEPECTEWEYQTLFIDDDYPGDPACPTVWAMQNITPTSTHDVNTLRLCLWRTGSPTYTDVYVYACDYFTWHPSDPPLASAAIDVSGLTTDPAGEWVDVTLNTTVTMEVDQVYAILLKGRDTCGGEDWNAAVWTTTYQDASEYFGTYAYSWDSGANWTWPSRDALFECWDCDMPETTYAALYETWGYTPSTYPAWYQAWPSFLKLAYIGVVLTSAVLAYRYEPRKEYPPDLPEPPDMPMS